MSSAASIKELLKNLEKSSKAVIEESTTTANKLRGTPVIDEMYSKVLKIQDTIGKESSPVNRIKYMQELTELIRKI